ncbi:MAG: radical SAM protein [Pseudomonadota bacterium]
MLLNWSRIDSEVEIFPIQINDYFFAYFPLKHTSFRVTSKAYDQLIKGDSNVLSTLTNKVSHKDTIKLKEFHPIKDFRPHRVDLAITTRCNLNCVYCHANSNEDPKDMDQGIAIKAVDFILENAKEQNVPYAQVGFNGGGEPTANFKLMKEITEYSKKRASDLGIKVHFGMATNAFFTEKQREFIKDNFSHLAISLDGKARHHNVHRPTIAGKDSFDTVFANAKYLHDNGIKNFNIRATISERTVDDIGEILEFFINEFPKAGYSFMPINRLGRGEICLINPPKQEKYIDMFKEVLLEKQLCQMDRIFFMCGLLSTVRSTFCDAFSGPGFNINVDGLLAACQRDNLPNEFYFGQISAKSGIKIDYNRLNYFKEPRIVSDKSCCDCFAKYHCGGECMDLVLHKQSRCKAIQRWNAYQLLDLHNCL